MSETKTRRGGDAAEAELSRFTSKRERERLAAEGERQAEAMWKEGSRFVADVVDGEVVVRSESDA